MAHHGAGFPSMFFVRCIVAVINFTSEFYVVTKIWLGVDGNYGSYFLFRSVNKTPTYKPTYVRKNLPEYKQKNNYIAPNS